MQRDLNTLPTAEYDLVVVGGGMTGICIAWDAASRGLKVALLEQHDFAHGASGNCFKMVHGGIRYLQHLDLKRTRESSQERNVLLRIAPHLVRPLPIVIPAYGHGLKGREFLRLGTLVYDATTFDRNRDLADSRRRLPWARALSRTACLDLFPGLPADGLSGGVMFHDGQMHSPARLALAVLKSAAAYGANAANYVRVTGFMRTGAGLRGVQVVDGLTGDEFEVRGRVIVNAAGGWVNQLLAGGPDLRPMPPLAFSRDAALFVKRRLTGPYGLAILGATHDPDAVLSRGRRHLFIAPWRDGSLVGVWHASHERPEDTALTEHEVREYLDEVNAAYPALNLGLDDVATTLTGLTLFGQNQPGQRNLSYGKRSIIRDHWQEHGVGNLVSVISVRYTVARGVAERAVDLVFQKLGRHGPASPTASIPVYGGAIGDTALLSLQARARFGGQYTAATIDNLVRLHGSAYTEVLQCADADQALRSPLGGSATARAEVVHAVQHEMALKLADVVLRRTDLGTAGDPGEAALLDCAGLMARELGWGDARVARELDEVRSTFPSFGATPALVASAARG